VARPKTLEEKLARLNAAELDFAFAVLKPMIPLMRRLGVTKFKPWVEERLS
jgi:hypothetical protein